MPVLDIAFEWRVDDAGYRIVHRPNKNPAIVRKGGPLRAIRPLGYHDKLWRQFGDLEPTERSCLDFAGRFGLLGLKPGLLPEQELAVHDAHEPLWAGWTAEIDFFKKMIAQWEASPQGLLSDPRFRDLFADVRARLIEGPPDGRPTLALQPRSLLSAMRLQFFQFVGSGRDLKECAQCGTWFEVGAEGRRADARFCSDRCRVIFHNRKRERQS